MYIFPPEDLLVRLRFFGLVEIQMKYDIQAPSPPARLPYIRTLAGCHPESSRSREIDIQHRLNSVRRCSWCGKIFLFSVSG